MEAKTVDLILYGLEHGMTDQDVAEARNLDWGIVAKMREILGLSALSRDHALVWEPPDFR